MAPRRALLGSLDSLFTPEKSKYVLQQGNPYREYLPEASKLLVGCIRLKGNSH